jgi:hypothetical protein
MAGGEDHLVNAPGRGGTFEGAADGGCLRFAEGGPTSEVLDVDEVEEPTGLGLAGLTTIASKRIMAWSLNQPACEVK